MEQEKEATELETIPQKSKIPPLPHWPTSKRGPMVTEPPPGQKRVHLRTEQVVEIDLSFCLTRRVAAKQRWQNGQEQREQRF